jgi:oxalate decarboxylase
MVPERRQFLGGFALGAGVLSAGQALGAEGDGRAAGREAASSSSFVRTLPRKTGAAQAFTASLDEGPLKATSGGWARDITTNQLPIATGIAGAHLFLNPGGVREMHWHSSAEWAYVIAGQCQATVIDPDGGLEVVNFSPGDTWYFPAGHAHAIQAIGTDPCHAVLAFDDGSYSDHGTFGLSDWLSRLGAPLLDAAFKLDGGTAKRLPEGETYIMQGPVIGADSDVARAQKRVRAGDTHHFALLAGEPLIENAAGSLHVAPARVFPISTTMTGFKEVLAPGAVHAPHWHPSANEWHFLVSGRTRVTMYEPQKRLGTAEMKAGDCAYFPRAAGHMVENIGTVPCEIVGVLDSAAYQECSLAQWLALAPRQVVSANLGLSESDVERFATVPACFVKL